MMQILFVVRHGLRLGEIAEGAIARRPDANPSEVASLYGRIGHFVKDSGVSGAFPRAASRFHPIRAEEAGP
jgi:hypothetical protein